jgi:23S rRNA (cytidine1920-2'-O)/16S rRNA (cytidine1409-2'-O)-methyltransferase
MAPEPASLTERGRLDRILVDRGLARSRGQAADLIAQGMVAVDGVVATKAATSVGPGQVVTATPDPSVSRAAHKLRAALDESATAIPARVLDAGASTGGFTQVLLERGAERVYAVDVGHGQLVAALRADPRVVTREGTNLRDLTLVDVEGEPVDLVVADVSFISLTLLVGPLFGVLTSTGRAFLLVKPQFEVGRSRLGSGGLVTRESDRRDAVAQVIAAGERLGWISDWQAPSRYPGTHGNTEYFVRFGRQ